MTTPGEGIQIGDLKPSSQSLAAAAQGYQDSASLAPQIPNAGASTGTVGQLLVSFAHALSQCAQVAAHSADAVEVCDTRYVETDQAAASRVASVGNNLPEGR